mmetsp:Transcript_972/g.3761  ORF Transcript_972/g.3761 Transcript_972/m.3761 type:complete len:82 (+) Transcript_972:7595-7840(+)
MYASQLVEDPNVPPLVSFGFPCLGALDVSMSKTVYYLQRKGFRRHISFNLHTWHSWRKSHQKVLREKLINFLVNVCSRFTR